MNERSIEDLLSLLPEPAAPDPEFEERLRRRVFDELRAPRADAPDAATGLEPTEVLELEATTTQTVRTRGAPATWLRAGAAAAIVAVGAAVAVAAIQDDDSSTTATAPAATFVGATVEAITIDHGPDDPYFVGAHGDAWVTTLAGDLIRITSSGATERVRSVPESSPLAVDGEAVWVADAVDGRVLRIDRADGSVVAEIQTDIEVLSSTFRIPMEEGASRQFSLIGGIVSNGESVWVGDKAGRVLRIDAESNEIAGSFEVPVRPDQLQIDGEHLLVVNLTGSEAAVVDSSSGELVRQAEEVDDLVGAAVHGGALFLQDGIDGTVTRIDLESGDAVSSQPLGASIGVAGQPVLPTGLVVSPAGVLVDVDKAGESLRILDPETLAARGALAVEPDHGDMTVAPDGTVWLVRGNAQTVLHITPRPI